MSTENSGNTGQSISHQDSEVKSKESNRKKKKSKKNTRFFKQVAIIVAIISLITAILVNYLQGYNSQKLQRREFESTLITKAIETGSSNISKQNLKFLLDIGLISDKENKIRNIITDTSYIITKGKHPYTQAFICMSRTAYAYHSIRNCIALKRCMDSVIAVPIAEAETNYHRKPCRICN